MFIALVGLYGPCVRAQVLSISEDGGETVYSGPTQFADDGVKAIGSYQSAKSNRFPVLIAKAAESVGLSPDLVAAVAWRESGFRTDRVSQAGAIGEMQLMPGTARALGVDPAKPDENLRGGAIYLRNLLTRYKGDLPLALAAYNAGPGAVALYGGAPPYPETQAYVSAILDRLSDVAMRRGETLNDNSDKPGARGAQ
jgi:soluble lytic murein transglycosylase-like protein